MGREIIRNEAVFVTLLESKDAPRELHLDPEPIMVKGVSVDGIRVFLAPFSAVKKRFIDSEGTLKPGIQVACYRAFVSSKDMVSIKVGDDKVHISKVPLDFEKVIITPITKELRKYL